MRTKHTPGPYGITAGDGERTITAPDGHGPIAIVKMRPTKTDNIAELEANAALFRAAPDLLNFTHNAANLSEEQFAAMDVTAARDTLLTIRALAKAAIAKAEYPS